MRPGPYIDPRDPAAPEHVAPDASLGPVGRAVVALAETTARAARFLTKADGIGTDYEVRRVSPDGGAPQDRRPRR